MIVIPAIDLRGGRAVRLLHGEPRGTRRSTTTTPSRSASASWRGAPGGCMSSTSMRRSRQRRQPRAIAGDLPRGRGAGAGRRRRPHPRRHRRRGLEGGEPLRAILGTTAALDPALVLRAWSRSTRNWTLVAVDVRGGHVMVKGWQEEGPLLGGRPARRSNDAGSPRYLVTAIARDGTLDGPDLRLLPSRG